MVVTKVSMTSHLNKNICFKIKKKIFAIGYWTRINYQNKLEFICENIYLENINSFDKRVQTA